MSALRLSRRAAGCPLLFLVLLISLLPARSAAQQFVPPRVEASSFQIAALAERLAVQLLAANKKRPFVLDLTLPSDLPCPLGAWLADKISESLALAHPALGVIPRSQTKSAAPAQFFHDRNQEIAANESRAVSLGAEVLVHGNFAATPVGIGITLIADDRPSGGDSRFEALAEIPLTAEMRAQLTSPLPERVALAGSFKASTAGIGSAICDVCTAPEYTYVAQAKRLSGVVILQVWVSSQGVAENTRMVRAPNEALANAATRAVRNWRFKPATNASGEVVPVVVDVAVSFQPNPKQFDASALRKSARNY